MFGDALASRYREEMLAGELQYWDEAYFAGEARDSLAKQRERERSDSLSFDDFIITNFNSGAAVTFPKYVYTAATRGIPAQANVIASAVFLIAIIGVVISQVAAGIRRKRLGQNA